MADSKFTRQPIDGNAVLRDFQQRRDSIPKGYGEFTRPKDGQTILSAFTPPKNSTQEDIAWGEEAMGQQDLTRTRDEEIANEIYDQEEYDGGREMVTDEYMSPDGGSGNTNSYQNNEDPDADRTGVKEYEDRRMDTMTKMGSISNFMEKTGMSMDDIFNDIDPNIPKEDIEMLLDGRNMKTDKDAYGADMAMEGILDAIGADHEIFFKSGEVVECGAECQERRAMHEIQGQEISDDQFEKKYSGVLG